MRIGLTGGIGCGKTTVSDYFAKLGVTVVDADEIAHRITKNNHPVLSEIARVFGPGFIDSKGTLDRKRMRIEVFRNPPKRQLLEQVLHPVIRDEMEQAAGACNGPYCIMSIPLLVEGGDTAHVDRILVVDAPDEKRREWIRARSGLDDAEIDAIFAAQVTREQRLAAADDVILNSSDLASLHRKVEQLHERYLEIVKNRGFKF